jgi:hypothetical protein
MNEVMRCGLWLALSAIDNLFKQYVVMTVSIGRYPAFARNVEK